MKIKKHHIKHVGFFIAVLTVLVSSLLIIGNTFNVGATGTESITVEFGGVGEGASVSSSPAGVNCPGDCSGDFAENSSVTLTAAMSSNYAVSNWSVTDASSGSLVNCAEGGINWKGSTCTVDLNEYFLVDAISVELSTAYKQSTLNVQVKGTGSGTVTSSPGGINCPGSCSNSFSTIYDGGSSPVLTAAPGSGSEFAGWGTSVEGATQCLDYSSGSGKGGSPSSSRKTTSTCTASLSTSNSDSGTAIAYFNKVSVEDDSESSGAADNSSVNSSSGSVSSNEESNSQTDGQAIDETASEEKQNTDSLTLVEQVKLNGQQVNLSQTSDKPMFKKDEPIKLSGQAEPNATVKLYIFSEPQEATVQADETGYWEYTITDIEPGEHRVEVATLDSESGEEGERAVVAQFNVSSDEAPSESASLSTDDEASELNWLVVSASILGLVAIGYIGWYWWHHKDSLLTHHMRPKLKNPAEADSTDTARSTEAKDIQPEEENKEEE